MMKIMKANTPGLQLGMTDPLTSSGPPWASIDKRLTACKRGARKRTGVAGGTIIKTKGWSTREGGHVLAMTGSEDFFMINGFSLDKWSQINVSFTCLEVIQHRIRISKCQSIERTCQRPARGISHPQ